MAIEFKKISHIYDKEMPYAFLALKDIDLSLEEGKIYAIIGETGSGKSTLVQHFNGLLLPHSGKINIFEHEIEANKKPKGLKALRKDVGLVFQFSEYQLFEETILKDVAFGPKNFGFSEEEAIEKAKKALALVGIDASFYERSPLDLSGGQKRRVAIAGILAMDPKIIVLDEPTAGLDPKGAKDMIALFKDLNQKSNKTIIIVSHDNEIVYNHSDELLLLSKGELIIKKNSKAFFNDLALVEKNHLLPPFEIRFKKALIDVGFKPNGDGLEKMINELVKEVKR